MRLIVAKGSFFECGRAVGAAIAAEAARTLVLTRSDLVGHPGGRGLKGLHRAAIREARAARDAFPGAYEYLAGLSEGTGLAFADMALLMFVEEVAAARMREKCSTLSVPTREGWLIGHNEDYGPDYFRNTFAADLRVDGYPRVFLHSYIGHPGCTLNEAGVAIANNSLWADPIPGPSQNLRHFRAAFASDMDEALGILTAAPNAYTTHYTVAWGGGHDELVSVEVSNRATASPETVVIDPREASICHANHVLYLGLRQPDPALEAQGYTTLARQRKLQRLIVRGQEPRTPEAMLALLTKPDGVLHRTMRQSATSVTLASVVMRPKTGEMWIRDADPAAEVRDLYLSFRASSLN